MGFMSKKQQPTSHRRIDSDHIVRTRATSTELDNRYSFRRNRTLTGSLSSDIGSANEGNAELKSPRVHSHHLRKHRRHAFSALLAVMAVAGILSFLLLQSIVRVQVTADIKLPDPTMYESRIHGYLLSHPLERFRFSLNVNSLVAYLQAHDMPEVESISSDIKPDGIGGAMLRVVFRKPVVLWQTASTRLYVDSSGNSFKLNHHSEPAVQVVDQTGIQSQDNQVLASDRFIAFIGRVVGRMQDNGLTVSEVILPADTTRQVQVRATGVDYPIKFSVDRPAGEQAEDAARAIRYLQQNGIIPEYLDIRISGRAFYK